MSPIAIGLFIFAYLSAVVDGIVQDKGTYPESGGRTGVKRFAKEHPLIVVGALAGILATVLAA